MRLHPSLFLLRRVRRNARNRPQISYSSRSLSFAVSEKNCRKVRRSSQSEFSLYSAFTVPSQFLRTFYKAKSGSSKGSSHHSQAFAQELISPRNRTRASGAAAFGGDTMPKFVALIFGEPRRRKRRVVTPLSSNAVNRDGGRPPQADGARERPGAEHRPYYLYVLIDPRNGEPFYVGKGRGNRMYDHWDHRSPYEEIVL